MLQIPDYIEKTQIVGAPIKYKWNNDIGIKYAHHKDQDIKLYEKIEGIGFKGQMALGMAVSEWGIWRYQGLVDIEDALYRVEAGWAEVADPGRAKDLRFKLTNEVQSNPDNLKAPFELLNDLLGGIYARFSTGRIDLPESVVRQVIFVRYILPLAEKNIKAKAAFDNWLDESIKRLESFVPVSEKQKQYLKENSSKSIGELKANPYDYSEDMSVPREFFSPDFSSSKADIGKAIDNFLNDLDKNNPYIKG